MFGIKLAILIPIVLVIGLLAVRRTGMLTWAFVWWVGMWSLFKFGFVVPIPQSVVTIYMAIVSLSILAYVASSRERWNACIDPIYRLIVQPRLLPLLALVVVAIPALVAFNVYATMNVPLEAPSFGRTIHPAPPDTITVHDNEIDLVKDGNPYRHLETDDPEAFKGHLETGRKIYFENCFWCHGDAMAGDGMFAPALNPIPTNFTDQGVLPMLQENFLFWRISKGGPGMPEEGGPWDSAMPAWESFLTEQEMWEVVLFLYDYTDWRPRAQHELH